MSKTSVVEKWVDEAAALTKPTKVIWADGSEAGVRPARRGHAARRHAPRARTSRRYPGCYLHRSHPQDVARTEQLTFICTRDKNDAGPTNNWMEPEEAKAKAGAYFKNSMSARKMWVIPYLMGPAGSATSRTGVMVTDSAYVVASMHVMTRVGQVAIDHMRSDDDFIAGLHGMGDLSPDRRLILHFPEEKLIWSVGSGYGGNALLGKKCHALRMGSSQARQEGWMAEHMFILGVEDPEGRITYFGGGDAERVGQDQPRHGRLQASRLSRWTLGDDIAWIYVDAQGQLRAINPGARLLRRGSEHQRRRPTRTASTWSAPTPSSPTSP